MYLKKYVRKAATQSLLLGAFFGFFALGLPLASAAILPTGGTINNQAPSAPSTTDNSSRTSPTNVGTAVTFTSTSTDPNGEQYYLAICKTSAVTAGTDAAPTCPGGSWAISTATNSGSPASASYTTLIGDTEESNWFAFACDKVASGALCSAADSTNSPFATNHRPTYSGYAATDSSGGSIEPGETIKFAVTTADSDSLQPDTVAVYVCASGNTFNGSACSGTELCHVALATAGAVSCTTATSPVPVPTAAGSTNVEVFVVD
ncbi:hypothetical protein HZA44_02580, partial [Candidatus Peregrinibacteria bacterium]|nr:hypothetical protein [Candidatus Peregrinibacteria bacterium]